MVPVTPESGRPIVELRSVTKIYAGPLSAIPTLDGVDLDVQGGEIVALRGPSGSGKSTLLNLLGCLDRPTSGTYLLGGCDVSSLGRAEQAWVRLHYLGFIFQSFHLLPHSTALENVALPLHYAGRPPEDCERIAADRLGRVGLGERLHYFPAQLSGGQRQRVAIARALTMAPRLLLADEPTGALDSRSGTEIMRLLVELHEEQGTAIVLVTHDPRVAEYAHRQIFLRDGKVVSEEEAQRVHPS
ncbi:MAG: ABC transporter ATP-binding protein [Deltaproteobacteria bacterium]|nr:ABC transporter ATP-binding protein [Deltaproteobacteria bacterium]